MKKTLHVVVCTLFVALVTVFALCGCGVQQSQEAGGAKTVADDASATDKPSSTDQMADSSDMAEPVKLDLDGLEPVTAEVLVDGTYNIDVDSSSSMFKIVSCDLTVDKGALTARMTMGGTGYLYVYPGTPEQAAAADKADYIPYEEEGESHVFTIPVKALNEPVPCAAFSKKKELWYARDLVFKADSLPAEAFAKGRGTKAQDLNLADGTYTVDVTLEGGSGRATVDTPARITVSNGAVTALIRWSSSNYDYMVVNGERLEPVNEGGNSEFEVPVAGFDYRMPVTADTTAMSKSHEIDYTLYFDSSTIAPTNDPASEGQSNP